MIDGKTRVCCVIGNPVEHALSPAMHNAAFAELKLNWVYVAFPVRDVAAAVQGLRGLQVRGASVTIPHKAAVIPYLDRLDPVAEWIGAVNTIVNNDGELAGLNTDGAGAMKSLLAAGVPLAGKRVLVLGSGGAARAIAITLAAKAGIGGLALLGIVEAELIRLAADVRERTGMVCERALMDESRLARAMAEADVLIHCSPTGMYPKEGETVVPARLFRKGLWVMDIVYNPRETRLLQEARAAGCGIVHGLEMLLNQGVLQFEAWTGKPAPEAVMRKALEESLARK
jgi:shikimate dehydrogenase